MKKIIPIIFSVVIFACFFCGCATPTTLGEVEYSYSINTDKEELEIGSTFQIVAAYGKEEISYLSMDLSVATVDSSGLVTAVGVGKTYIKISAQTSKNDVLCEIIVNDFEYKVEISSQGDYEVYVGAYKSLKAVALRDDVAYVDNITWSVDDKNATLLTVGNTALFIANAAGKYKVTATSGKGASETIEITVVDANGLA